MTDRLDLAALFDLEPSEAVAAFEAKGYTLSWNWHEVWKVAHAKSFTVAKLARLDVRDDIRSAVHRSLADGETERWFVQRLTGLLQTKGWWGRKIVVDADGQAEVVQEGSPRRLQTIFRTNLQTSYAAGRWARFADNAKMRPYLQYVAILDGRTRPSHARLHGRIWPINSPVWSVIAPPNGWNCRCALRALSADDVASLGLRVEENWSIVERPVSLRGLTDQRTGEVDPDKLLQRGVSVPDPTFPGRRVTLWTDIGWDYNPGAAGADQLSDRYRRQIDALPPDLAAAVRRVTVDLPSLPPAKAFWDVATAHGAWHEEAFKDAPQVLKIAISDVQKVPTVRQNPRHLGACDYIVGYIEMGSKSSLSLTDRAIWRHEFGHWIDCDRNVDRDSLFRSQAADFSKAMRSDADRLRKGAGLGLWEGAAERQSTLAAAREAARIALRSAADGDAHLAERFRKLGIDITVVMRSLEVHTWFGGYLSSRARNDRLCDLATACEHLDAEGLVRALTGFGNGTAEWLDKRNDGLSSALSDLFGSATANVVCGLRTGFGHDNGYYRRSGFKNTECWANLTCIVGSGDLFFDWIISRFAPEMRSVFLEAIK
ncbi:MAG TPA: phage minor head protein [Pseudomonadota bacterium]|nr:phage minor head protein [Pseudomonadota bacterium]